MGFLGGAVVKNLPANAGDVRDASSITVSGSSPGEGNGNPLLYSFLENPMDRGAWWACPWGRKGSETSEQLSSATPPIQTSVMENFQAFFLSYNSGSGKAFRVLLQT